MSDSRSSLSVPDRDLVVISGGQTGVDRAALDAALELGICTAGWCPQGRRSEDGRIPPVYQLTETESRNYAVRTRWNVRDSDGTLIVALDEVSGGTELTAQVAQGQGKPLQIVRLRDGGENSPAQHVQCVVDWIVSRKIRLLNVAGPRGSSDDHIYSLAREFCSQVFSALKHTATI